MDQIIAGELHNFYYLLKSNDHQALLPCLCLVVSSVSGSHWTLDIWRGSTYMNLSRFTALPLNGANLRRTCQGSSYTSVHPVEHFWDNRPCIIHVCSSVLALSHTKLPPCRGGARPSIGWAEAPVQPTSLMEYLCSSPTTGQQPNTCSTSTAVLNSIRL